MFIAVGNKYFDLREKRTLLRIVLLITPFAVHCGKIRIDMRQSSVNKTNINSFARRGNHYAKRTLICEFCIIFGIQLHFWSFNCAFGHSMKK